MRILDRKRECGCGDLVDELPVAQSTVSQHLKVLKAAALVRDHADGTRRIYSLDPAGLGPIREWLDRFWDRALAAYAEAAEREDSQ